LLYSVLTLISVVVGTLEDAADNPSCNGDAPNKQWLFDSGRFMACSWLRRITDQWFVTIDEFSDILQQTAQSRRY